MTEILQNLTTHAQLVDLFNSTSYDQHAYNIIALGGVFAVLAIIVFGFFGAITDSDALANTGFILGIFVFIGNIAYGGMTYHEQKKLSCYD